WLVLYYGCPCETATRPKAEQNIVNAQRGASAHARTPIEGKFGQGGYISENNDGVPQRASELIADIVNVSDDNILFRVFSRYAFSPRRHSFGGNSKLRHVCRDAVARSQACCKSCRRHASHYAITTLTRKPNK